jgi:hypothetical protein
MMPPDIAFEFDMETYFKGAEHYWHVRERLWNIDADPDPLKQREYVIGRPIYETLEVEEKRLSEMDLLSHFEEVPQEEAEAAFEAQKTQQGGERAG